MIPILEIELNQVYVAIWIILGLVVWAWLDNMGNK